MTHELKTDPIPFHEAKRGQKTFELRRNDRDFQPGDEIVLRETVYSALLMREGRPLDYTGEVLRFRAGYILRSPAYGIPEGFCIISLLL